MKRSDLKPGMEVAVQAPAEKYGQPRKAYVITANGFRHNEWSSVHLVEDGDKANLVGLAFPRTDGEFYFEWRPYSNVRSTWAEEEAEIVRREEYKAQQKATMLAADKKRKEDAQNLRSLIAELGIEKLIPEYRVSEYSGTTELSNETLVTLLSMIKDRDATINFIRS